MYLSRISLNKRRRGAMKLLGSRHAMHAAVMSAFPPATPTVTDSGRVLWRVDREDERVDLLIASPAMPCLAHIGEQAGWSTSDTWTTRDYSPLLRSLDVGQKLYFRLAANPTHRVTFGDEKAIVGHGTIEHQTRWLLARAEDNGFAVMPSSAPVIGADPALRLELSERERTTFRRGEQRVTLSTVRYDGELTVTDAAGLRRALTHGIGRAKGYGCGMMTVLPQ